jgi:hypothetical protein
MRFYSQVHIENIINKMSKKEVGSKQSRKAKVNKLESRRVLGLKEEILDKIIFEKGERF